MHHKNNHDTLTVDALRETIHNLRRDYPPEKLVKEFRLKDPKHLTSLVPHQEHVTHAWGIPILSDERVPVGKIKFVYQDGREETYDLSAQGLPARSIGHRSQDASY